MNTTFPLAVDKENKIKVESSIAYANWVFLSAYAGYETSFEIGTVFAGNGAPVEVTVKTGDGKKIASWKGRIVGNKCIGSVAIPEKMKIGNTIYFECKLPKHKVSMESNEIPVNPMLKVIKICWDKKEVARDELLTCKVEFEKDCIENGTTALLIIKEYDRDNNHDIITKIPVVVVNNRIETQWKFRFADNTENIPTNDELKPYGKQYQYPEYFFTVDVDGVVVGKDQESGLVRFRDTAKVKIIAWPDFPIANANFTLELPDGTKVSGRTDSDGNAVINGVSPGLAKVTVEGYDEVFTIEIDKDNFV
jgi:hypothetical protein